MALLKKIMYQGEDLSQGLNEEDREEEEEEEKKGVKVSKCGSAMVEIKGLDLTASHHCIGTNQVCDVGWNKNTVSHLLFWKKLQVISLSIPRGATHSPP